MAEVGGCGGVTGFCIAVVTVFCGFCSVFEFSTFFFLLLSSTISFVWLSAKRSTF